MIKTKVLDGICLQRWSVWLNWMQTLQSYDIRRAQACRGAWLHSVLGPSLTTESTRILEESWVKVSPHAQCNRLLSLYSCLTSRWDRYLELADLEPGIASTWVFMEPTKCISQMCTHRPSRCASKLLSEVVTRCPDWKARMKNASIHALAAVRSVT